MAKLPTLKRANLIHTGPGAAGLILVMSMIGIAKASSPLPAEIDAFLNRQAQCRHWADEDPYDEARAHEIAQSMDRLRCMDLQAEEQDLRRRYPNAMPVPDTLEERDTQMPE